jgi:integrase
VSGKRSYGSGRVYLRADARGSETFYGLWRANGRRMHRKLGLKRSGGVGITAKEAEAELRRLMAETQPSAQVAERVTVAAAAKAYMADAERRGRKPTTIASIDSALRTHLEPFFGSKAIDTIRVEDVDDLIAALQVKKLTPKSIRNVIGVLSAVCNYARKRRSPWSTINPCEGAQLPSVQQSTEPRFLTLEQVDALIAHLPASEFLTVDRAVILTAALTGLRKGELIALRWQDVDWSAQRIRVRRNHTHKAFGTPKSRRSTRSVPMADEIAGELDRLFKQSAWQGDADLVFAHPRTGGPMPEANISRRMTRALNAAGLDSSHRFHDLRHTFGTRAAAAGVPLRTVQEWMGHQDIQTTMIYADYCPGAHEAEMIDRAFRRVGSDDRMPVVPMSFQSEPTSEHPT